MRFFSSGGQIQTSLCDILKAVASTDVNLWLFSTKWPIVASLCDIFPWWQPIVTLLCDILSKMATTCDVTLWKIKSSCQKTDINADIIPTWPPTVTSLCDTFPRDGGYFWRHSMTFFQDDSRPWRHMNHAASRGGVSRRQGRPPTVTPPLDMRQPTSTPPMQQRPAVGGYPPAGSSPVVGYPPASAPASPLPAGRVEAAGERRLFSRNFNGTCE